MNISQVTVTPEGAAKLLANRTDEQERRVNKAHVSQLAAVMLNGQWQNFNGDTICIDTEQNLIDGQHRLLASVESNTPIGVIMVTGVSPNSFYTKDQGIRTRGAADVMRMKGIANCDVLSVAMRLLWHYKNETNPSSGGDGPKPTARQLYDLLESNIDSYIESCKKGMQCRSALSAGPGTFLHIIFKEKSPDEADNFFDILKDGATLNKFCPAKVLRDKLLIQKASKLKMSMRDRVSLAIHSWNHFRQGKNLKMVRLPKRKGGKRLAIRAA